MKKASKAANLKKSVPRGSIRVADGASVLGARRRSAPDVAHVTHSSPIALKKNELQNDPRYRTKMQPGTEREKFTSRKRGNKDVKPIADKNGMQSGRESHSLVPAKAATMKANLVTLAVVVLGVIFLGVRYAIRIERGTSSTEQAVF